MRVTPLIGKKVWFAPRRDGLGAGWAPVSWEGWFATMLAVCVAIVSLLVFDRDVAVWPGGTAVFSLVLLSFLKGTSPGGRRARAEYEQVIAQPDARRPWR